jgi:hypothetical protein
LGDVAEKLRWLARLASSHEAAPLRFRPIARSIKSRRCPRCHRFIEATNLTKIPDNFRLVLEMELTERRCTVVWRKKTRIGIRFK